MAVDIHGADRRSSSANRCGAKLSSLNFKALGQVTVERPASDGDDQIGCDCGTRVFRIYGGWMRLVVRLETAPALANPAAPGDLWPRRLLKLSTRRVKRLEAGSRSTEGSVFRRTTTRRRESFCTRTNRCCL